MTTATHCMNKIIGLDLGTFDGMAYTLLTSDDEFRFQSLPTTTARLRTFLEEERYFLSPIHQMCL